MEFWILDGIQRLRTPALDVLMPAVTHLGDAGLVWGLLAVILFFVPGKRKSGVILAAALVLDVVVCNGILKHVFARVRPCEVQTVVQLLIARPTDYSFPSGHTAASFAAVSALYFAGEKRLWKPALALAALIAFSRLYLYVHYPSDILGGIAVGTAAGFAAAALADRCMTRFELRKKARKSTDAEKTRYASLHCGEDKV